MSIADIIKSLPRRSKVDDIPGTIEEYLDERCPLCSRKFKIRKPCCSNPNFTKECSCGYKIILTDYNSGSASSVMDEGGPITETQTVANP